MEVFIPKLLSDSKRHSNHISFCGISGQGGYTEARLCRCSAIKSVEMFGSQY